MECEIMGAVVSQTRVKSLGTTSDMQPQKHVTSWTRYHCQVRRATPCKHARSKSVTATYKHFSPSFRWK